MKKIKLLILTTLIGIGSVSYAAVISITGTVTNSGAAASGIQVIWTDSASMISDTAISNSLGKYTVTLTGTANGGQLSGYITDCNRRLVYKNLFYNSGSTTYSNQDFVYCSTPPAAGYSKVSGAVYTVNGLAVNANVLLILNDSGRLTAVDTFVLRAGRYSFILPDSTKQYLVKAILLSSDPNYSSYLPTYGDSSLRWSRGRLLPIGGNKTHSRNIWMKIGRNTGGAGFIGGLVTSGANKSEAVGDPIEGAQVMLLQNNIPVAYAYSNNKGEFSFDKLDNGTYTVYTEVIGLPTVSADVIITAADNKEEKVNVSINSSGVTTKVGEATSLASFNTFSGLKAFPNPIKNIVTIDFGMELKSGIISVLDITGKVLQSKEINGLNELNLSFENYRSGTYLIRITNSEDNNVLRVIKQ